MYPSTTQLRIHQRIHQLIIMMICTFRQRILNHTIMMILTYPRIPNHLIIMMIFVPENTVATSEPEISSPTSNDLVC